MLRAERGQSEVIGVVLLLGLTVLVVSATVALGSVALDDTQSTAELQKAEGAMTQVDSKASLVAHGESTSQRVEIAGAETGELRVDENAGWMEVVVDTGNETTTKNVTLGSVVYEQNGETVAYQGGGVWRDDGDVSRMVSPPEFHYRGSAGAETLTLPLVSLQEGDGGLYDTVVISDTGGEPERLFPTPNGTNPLVGGEVTIRVGSEYAEAWGTFFETRTQAEVQSVGGGVVEVTLQTEIEHAALDASISSTGPSTLDMGGIKTMYADSYDSTEGAYDPNDSNAGAVVQTRDEFKLTSGGGGNTEEIEIHGDTVAESYNVPGGQEDKLNVTGEMREETVLTELNPVSGAISQRISAVRDQNLSETAPEQHDDLTIDGGSEMVIENDTYVNGAVNVDNGTLRVTDGATLHVASDVDLTQTATFELNTTNGNVTVLSDDQTDLQGDAEIVATGGGSADLYVDGELQMQDAATIRSEDDTRFEVHNTDDVDLDDQVNFLAADDEAGDLWFYSTAEEIEIEGDDGDGIDFTGVFYAPESEVELEDDMTIKGSFTFQTLGFSDADLSLHYDEALQAEQPFDGETVPVVSYLHVSAHDVTIEDDE